MTTRSTPWLIYVLTLCCLIAMPVQAGLQARLDRDRIAEGETVQLLVEADGQVSGTPDTRPLTKDFDVLGIASGSQVNIINGRMDARTTWTISRAPRRDGNLIVPALELNGEQTNPLALEVGRAPTAAEPAAGKPIFIETEVDRQEPYVQSMVRYTLRVFYRIDLAEASLSEPRPDNALVHRLGDDREYSVERGGRRYRVIERQYALFPQASGKLIVPAPVLDARVPDRSTRRGSPLQDFFGRDPFGDSFFGGNPLGGVFTATRPLRLRGKDQLLEVRPRPEQTPGSSWLPAESIVLNENWQPDDGVLRVGDPINRTLSIAARGLTGEQLPDLDPGAVEGFKVYPDRTKADTRVVDGNIQGEKSRSIAFVPIRPGKFTLPAVSLHWWDTLTDQARVADLPARTVQILPAVDGQNAPLPKSPPSNVEAQPAAPVQSAADNLSPADKLTEAVPAEARMAEPVAGIWLWVSGVFALLWLVTLGVWWRDRRHAARPVRRAGGAEESTRQDVARAKKQFISACRDNDPRMARRSLLQWAALHWPDRPPTGLDDLARRLRGPLAGEALADLDKTLYRGRGESWDGSALAAAVSELPRRASEKQGKAPLPDLYP